MSLGRYRVGIGTLITEMFLHHADHAQRHVHGHRIWCFRAKVRGLEEA